jgi:N-acetylmuramoyl-L-alanine amidase
VVFDLVKSEKPAPENKEKPQDTPPAPQPVEPVASKSKPIETICIDAGHGGEDLGALGKSKLLEKNVTLQISQKLKKLIESKTGLRVIMTRDKDGEVSLNSRASIANRLMVRKPILSACRPPTRKHWNLPGKKTRTGKTRANR